jgi:hypothetical protein
MMAAPMFAAAIAFICPSLAFGLSLALLALVGSSTAFAAFVLPQSPVRFDVQNRVERDGGHQRKCSSVSDVASIRQLPKL